MQAVPQTLNCFLKPRPVLFQANTHQYHAELYLKRVTLVKVEGLRPMRSLKSSSLKSQDITQWQTVQIASKEEKGAPYPMLLGYLEAHGT